MTLSTDDVERFWSKVDKSGECWTWTAGSAGAPSSGVKYGSFWVGGKAKNGGRSLRANRVAFETVNGPIPPGMCVCHRCDNPRCVRPDHLFLGTSEDNSRDRHAKGVAPCRLAVVTAPR